MEGSLNTRKKTGNLGEFETTSGVQHLPRHKVFEGRQCWERLRCTDIRCLRSTVLEEGSSLDRIGEEVERSLTKQKRPTVIVGWATPSSRLDGRLQAGSNLQHVEEGASYDERILRRPDGG
jgi:hypothetical protein